jgi:hypothetical protein
VVEILGYNLLYDLTVYFQNSTVMDSWKYLLFFVIVLNMVVLLGNPGCVVLSSLLTQVYSV